MKLNYINENISFSCKYNKLITIVEKLLSNEKKVEQDGMYEVSVPFGVISRRLFRTAYSNNGQTFYKNVIVKDEFRSDEKLYKDNGVYIDKANDFTTMINDYRDKLLVNRKTYTNEKLFSEKEIMYNKEIKYIKDSYYNTLNEIEKIYLTKIEFNDEGLPEMETKSIIYGYEQLENNSEVKHYTKVNEGRFKDFYQVEKYYKEDEDSEFVKQKRIDSYIYYVDIDNYIIVNLHKHNIVDIKLISNDTLIIVNETFRCQDLF